MTSTRSPQAPLPGFSVEHCFTLLKYTGISFIAGSINHGTFSETRSLVTAGIGMVAFVIGALLEQRAQARMHPGEVTTSWWATLSMGAIFSVGLGFFTGGLQHFPDSPTRSVWVVPVGFALATFSLALKYRRQLFTRTTMVALPALSTAVAMIVGGMFLFYTGPGAGSDAHIHGTEDTSHAASHDHTSGDHADGDHAEATPATSPAVSAVPAVKPSIVKPSTTTGPKSALARRANPTPGGTVTITRTVTATHQH